MNRADARLIAEELFRIQKREGFVQDRVVGIDEAAKILGLSVNTVYLKIKEIPHAKRGKILRFFVSDLYKYLRR